MDVFLGIDLGTSSVKCALIQADTLSIVGTTEEEYALHYPKAGYVEQDPDEWWQKTIQAVRKLMVSYPNHNVIGIGYSGQMHGTVLLDDDQLPIHPAIIWADQRSHDVLSTLIDTVGYEDYIKTTGTRPAVGFMASTLQWLKLEQPELLDRTSVVLLPKDYIRLHMTGTINTDVSDAAGTGLLDIATGNWAQTIITKMGLSSDIFPQITDSYTVVGQLLPAVADDMGLKAHIPIVAGCADQPAQAIGNGILNAGQLSITLGSGGQIFTPISNIAKTDDRIHLFNHAVGGWYALGAILSAGLALRWLRDTLGVTDDDGGYQTLSQLAGTVSAGSEGLIFVPYLNGTRTPHMNPNAQGGFIGLTSRHSRAHLVRSVMEGVAYSIKEAFDVCKLVTPHAVQKVVGAGGGLNSAIWRQIVVDVLNAELHQSQRTQQAALGAGVLAGIGIRYYGETRDDNIKTVSEMLSTYATVTHPTNQHTVTVYEDGYQIYKQIYPALNS